MDERFFEQRAAQQMETGCPVAAVTADVSWCWNTGTTTSFAWPGRKLELAKMCRHKMKCTSDVLNKLSIIYFFSNINSFHLIEHCAKFSCWPIIHENFQEQLLNSQP